jgi:hypothetical protein
VVLVQFCLLYSYQPDGPGAVEGDIAKWMALTDDLQAAGSLVHEAGFFPPSQAVTMTAGPDGDPTTTSGSQAPLPIAGYFTIQVERLDDAIEWAAKLPVVGKGTVEVRRVVEFEA